MTNQIVNRAYTVDEVVERVSRSNRPRDELELMFQSKGSQFAYDVLRHANEAYQVASQQQFFSNSEKDKQDKLRREYSIRLAITSAYIREGIIDKNGSK